jgi:short-subunit dehydrogenase
MNIIVNGGTRGIGKEIVLIMAKNAENRILVTGRNSEELKSLSEKAVHRNIFYHIIDISLYEKFRPAKSKKDDGYQFLWSGFNDTFSAFIDG